MFYVGKQEEVQTEEMIAAARKLGKRILVPAVLVGKKTMIASEVTNSQRLSCGPYGIRQPKTRHMPSVPGNKIDLVLVPGLAFDRQGRRLGRGAGYYDRFLADLKAGIPRIGLAYRFQVLNKLPAASHDIRLSKVISA